MTKKYARMATLFTFLNWLLCFGLLEFLIIYTIVTRTGRTLSPVETEILNKAKVYLIGLFPMAALAIIVKDKIRPLVWMSNIILSSIFISSSFMYAVFAVWVIDEYVISKLASYYKNKWIINKEIDKRGL